MLNNVIVLSPMSKIFVTSDTHFNHKNILTYCPNRKFASIEAMNEAIITDWNSKVTTNDIVYHLGDVAMGPNDKHIGFLSQLAGNIKIVPGNHDRYLVKIAKTNGLPPHVQMLSPIFNLKHKSRNFVLCHFPMEWWEGMAENSSDYMDGSIHLHGHTHGNMHAKKDRWDIGYDVFGGLVLLDNFVL